MGVAATVSQPEPAAVVSKAVSRAAALLGLSNAAFARTIGVSERTVSRLHKGSFNCIATASPMSWPCWSSGCSAVWMLSWPATKPLPVPG